MNTRQHCAIYKGKRKQETYLYVTGEDRFEDVPRALLDALGELQLVMTLELTPQRPLAREDVNTVIANLRQQGYHLQLPPARPGK